MNVNISDPPVVIGLLGPDGAGKSTIASMLRDDLNNQGYKVAIVQLGVYTAQENETPFIRSVKKFHELITRVNHAEKRRQSKNRRAKKQTLSKFGLGKSLVYFVDMNLRYLRALCSDHDVIIADRFFHDLLYYNQSVLVKKLIRTMERGPVHLFQLSTDSEVIATRSEHTVEYIEEMQSRLRDVDAHSLNVKNTSEECTTELLRTLQDRNVLRTNS